MRVFARCLLIFVSLLPRLQAAPMGRILPNVLCAEDPSQRYALYVPSTYAADRKWPVIFCFDPSARGLIPVERLRPAAEKYGYVVVGSLTSKNGPYEANAKAAKAMMRDVGSHLSLDPQRIYTVGMSGGARVATSIAMAGVAHGVIACGAGFPELEEGVPQRVPFVFYGIVGVEDFNLAEFRRLGGELEERMAIHHIAVFEGGHVWAPEAALTAAVEWLDLQAMRAGKKPLDRSFVETMFAARVAEVEKLAGLEQCRGLRTLAGDFGGLVDVADFARRADALSSSKEVKTALKLEKTFFSREERLLEELRELAPRTVEQKQRFAAKLQARMDAAGNVAERQMIRRAIAAYCLFARMTYREMMEKQEYARAASLIETALALHPENARDWFDLARAYAESDDVQKSIESVERAAKAGFADQGRMETEPAFARFRTGDRFKVALSRIAANRVDPTTELPAMRVSAALASVELRLCYQAKADGDPSLLAFLKVVNVRRGSAAERAGVVPGMEVLGIQKTRVSGLTEGALNDALAQPFRGQILLTVRESAGEPERALRIPILKAGGVATGDTGGTVD